MAAFYSVLDTEMTENRDSKDIGEFMPGESSDVLLEEDTEIQYIQGVAVEEEVDYFDGYFEVGVLFALGIIIGFLLCDMLIRKWHT